MGTFGTKNFQNDSAMDFEEEFTDNPSLETLEDALLLVNEYAEGEEYIEVDEACAALAAAEIVAAIGGNPAADLPRHLLQLTSTLSSSTNLQKLARKTVKQVMKESELQALWAEGDNLKEWLAVQTDLLNRLKQGRNQHPPQPVKFALVTKKVRGRAPGLTPYPTTGASR